MRRPRISSMPKPVRQGEGNSLGRDPNEIQSWVLAWLKKTYHMALDMIESEKEKNSKLRAEVMELKYQKKPSEAA